MEGGLRMSGEAAGGADVSIARSSSPRQRGQQEEGRVDAAYSALAAAVADLNGEVARLGELHAAALEQRERAVLPYVVAVSGVVARATGAAAGGSEGSGAQLRVRH